MHHTQAVLVYNQKKRERAADARNGIALVPAPTYLHPTGLHSGMTPRGQSGAFSDDLQPTESFRNDSDPDVAIGNMGGKEMEGAFA